mgnify:CR=1 FL=1
MNALVQLANRDDLSASAKAKIEAAGGQANVG